jgi:superfamily I DNA/RNA helicase
MKWTAEQESIINTSGNLKINAVAGSGKTTTMLEYARSRPAGSRILYLAFNKTVKLEAAKKFAEMGMPHVRVETAHSLAYKNVVFQHNYEVRPQGYRTHEIAELLGLQVSGEKHAAFIAANHINRFITYFSNSSAAKVQDLNYLDVVHEAQARQFVQSFYPYIELQTRQLLARMDRGDIPIIHDFYLKKFGLAKPLLPFDYILFDEAQDASAVMLDVFLQQRATRVMVGDTHQQIYGWRYAVNSMMLAPFQGLELSHSFRFGQDIADLAKSVLGWKKSLYKEAPNVTLQGMGKSKGTKTKAVIARSNLGLLLKAIEAVTGSKPIKHLYFEGNLSSYTYADDGASLYDVLHLHNGKNEYIRDALIRGMGSMSELEDYVEKTEDAQLAMMVEIVQQYENDIPGLLQTIRSKHVGDADRNQADLIFSTVHRCKGMEYDVVELAPDFITEKKLQQLVEESGEAALDRARLNEEINLLYVAITRARNHLHLPETYVAKDFLPSPHITLLAPSWRDEKKGADKSGTPPYSRTPAKGNGTRDRAVVKRGRYQAWNTDSDETLMRLVDTGAALEEMERVLQRTRGDVVTRIKKLGLWERE